MLTPLTLGGKGQRAALLLPAPRKLKQARAPGNRNRSHLSPSPRTQFWRHSLRSGRAAQSLHSGRYSSLLFGTTVFLQAGLQPTLLPPRGGSEGCLLPDPMLAWCL